MSVISPPLQKHDVLIHDLEMEVNDMDGKFVIPKLKKVKHLHVAETEDWTFPNIFVFYSLDIYIYTYLINSLSNLHEYFSSFWSFIKKTSTSKSSQKLLIEIFVKWIEFAIVCLLKCKCNLRLYVESFQINSTQHATTSSKSIFQKLVNIDLKSSWSQ